MSKAYETKDKGSRFLQPNTKTFMVLDMVFVIKTRLVVVTIILLIVIRYMYL